MNNFLILILLFLPAKPPAKTELVNQYYDAVNYRDHSKLRSILHPRFSSVDKVDTLKNIKKKDFIKNLWSSHCWKDSLKMISSRESGDTMEVVFEYKSFLAECIGISYGQEKSTFYFKDNKIIKIVGDTLTGFSKYRDEYNMKFYQFSDWLVVNYPEKVDIPIDSSFGSLFEEYRDRKK